MLNPDARRRVVGPGDTGVSIDGLNNRADLARFIEKEASKPNRDSVAIGQLRSDVDALVAGTVVDATSTVKGKLKLAGDLGGTADLPTVPGLAGKANTSHTHAQADVTNLTTDLAAKAPIASPTLTGTPAAPTATPGTNTTQIATTAFVAAMGALKANLASPTFTGVPAAPTATAGTNTTQLATTAFVTTADNLKANLASPALTGNPTAPTQTAGNNSTRLATTAYADGAVATASTADRARANHTGTQLASTISDFNTAVRTNRLDQMAAPTAPVTGFDAATGTQFVTRSQMEVADLAVTSGYKRLADVDKIPVWFAEVGDFWQVSLGDVGIGYTRSGNVLTASMNGKLAVAEVGETIGTSATAGVWDVTLGMELLIWEGVSGVPSHAEYGIYEVTQVGSGSQPWKLTRRADADTNGDLVQFNLVRSQFSGASAYLATGGSIVINTTAQEWVPYHFYPSAHAPTHAPGGIDALPTAAATAITGTNAEGSAGTFARSDHNHAITVEAWREIGAGGQPAFENSWVNFGGAFQTVAFYKDPTGRVHLKGLLKSGTVTATAFTLPTGYRPAARAMFMVNSNAAVGRVDVYADGSVKVEQGNNAWVGLDGISFRVA